MRAEYRGGHRLYVVFQTVAPRPWTSLPGSIGPVFEPLKNADYFQRFFVEAGTVTWPNGADIAPETLYTAQGVDEAAEQGDEADEAFGGMVARMDMPPHARAVTFGRGHRFAAYPRCWTDPSGNRRACGRHGGVGRIRS